MFNNLVDRGFISMNINVLLIEEIELIIENYSLYTLTNFLPFYQNKVAFYKS